MRLPVYGYIVWGDGVYICCLLGNRDTPRAVLPTLHFVLLDLIENKEVSLFYVGNQTAFDRMVQRELKMLRLEYPHIRYLIVLAYMPGQKKGEEYEDESNTIYPDGIENTPPKYAIRKRNERRIKMSDYVVIYAGHTYGYTAQFQRLAKRKNKIVINLADLMVPADGDGRSPPPSDEGGGSALADSEGETSICTTQKVIH